MKFKIACIKGGQHLIKLVLDNGEEKWAKTTEKVYSYAKKNFTEDEVCDFEYDVKNDSYTVAKILKKGSGETKKTDTSEGYKCEDCGAKLKDNKYKKCYNCNKKNPKPAGGYKGGYSGDYMRPKTPEESERIMRLSLMDSACEAVKVMTGSLGNVGAISDAVISIYDKIYKKVTE